jgi:ABC-type branched-subunit amino acid transport system ATPase component/MFS family permease
MAMDEPRVGGPRQEPDLDASIDDIDSVKLDVRGAVREAMGVGGVADRASLRLGIRRSGVGWYPLVAIGTLVAIANFQDYGFLILGPELSRALGVSKGTLAGLEALKTLLLFSGTLAFAALVGRQPRRALLAVTTAFVWSIMTLMTCFVVGIASLFVVLMLAGLAQGSVAATHPAIVVDAYPPAVRARALAFYRASDQTGSILAPLIVALATIMFSLTWRGAFAALGIACIVACLVCVRLRDPGVGRWDESRARAAVRKAADTPGMSTPVSVPQLRFFEVVRRLMLIPTIRRLLVAQAVLGMMLFPFLTFLFFFLQERWNMGPGARAVFFAIMPVFSILALSAYGRRGERIFKRDPPKLVGLTSALLAASGLCIGIAVTSPNILLMGFGFGGFFAAFAVTRAALDMVSLSIIPPEMRPHASALSGIFLAGVGGFAGLLLLSGIDRRFGTGGALASLVLPALAASLVLRGARRTVNRDLDRMVDQIVEEEEVAAIRSRNVQLPMLGCRKVNFSYGSIQVLFDVSFSVDDGEMVALLGTNGSGKSTLLRVLCGLALPTSGTVRLDGADITYLDAERRLHLGIVHIDSGRAVFEPLSVVDNLRMFGYTLGRDRVAIDKAISRSLAAFPALAMLRNRPASTLSGGEQQMLALSKALILAPRCLLIDELSLGLAPVIVGHLLDMVRTISASGTAVVLVEQSANMALSLVERAYFMEKGTIRFEGRASDLLQRRDLLRSVFFRGFEDGQADGFRTP